jgi:PAS domain S-box-containing protein
VSVRFDITKQKELEEDLRLHAEEVSAQEEELRQTMEEMRATNDALVHMQRELDAQIRALNNAAIVSETDVKGNITFVNDTFCEISQYSRVELIGQNHRILKSGHQPDEIFVDMWKTISAGNVWRGIVKNRAKDGSFYWVHTTITPVLGPGGKPERYIAVRVDITSEKEKEAQLDQSEASIQELNASLRLAKDQLEKRLSAKVHEIQDSVVYAQRIQRAVLTSPTDLKENAPKGFSIQVFFQPREAVSGDFYWLGRRGNKTVLACGDGTGHGVPGAFMTIMGITALTRLVEDRGVVDPVSLLDELDADIKHTLNQDREQLEDAILDSLEMSVLSIMDGSRKIRAASAERPMLLVHNGEYTELKPSRKPVGGTQPSLEDHYSNIDIEFEPGDTLFLFSDGYKDQLGGPGEANKKFGKTPFYELCAQLTSLPKMADWPRALYKKLDDWKGFFRDQTDDIVVVMIRCEE